MSNLLSYRNEKGQPDSRPFEYLTFAGKSIQFCYNITFPIILQYPASARYAVSSGLIAPEYQESNLELLAKMAQHRELCASLIGTMWRGDSSTSLGNTMMERAVEVSKI